MPVLPANALVSSRLDHCNSLFRGFSCFNKHKLQSIQNTFTCIVTNHRKYARVTPTLKQLHELPVSYCCMFKTATLVINSYITVLLRCGHPDRQYLTVPTSIHQSLSLTIVWPLMLLSSGKNSLMMYTVQHQLPLSGRRSKHTCLQKPIHHSLSCHPFVSFVQTGYVLG